MSDTTIFDWQDWQILIDTKVRLLKSSHKFGIWKYKELNSV